MLDLLGHSIKGDVFFSPMVRKHYCFQEFCNEFMVGNSQLTAREIIIAAGSGYIYKWNENEITEQLEYLLQTLLFLMPTLKIYVSTLWPQMHRFQYTAPFLYKFNRQIEAIMRKWHSNTNLDLIKTHELFCEEYAYLDENTGLLRESYVLKPEASSYYSLSGRDIGIKGWFLVRKMWLQKLGYIKQHMSASDSEEDTNQDSDQHKHLNSRNSRDSGLGLSDVEIIDIEEFEKPAVQWRSPPSVI